MRTGGIVLCGGQSQRMGEPKYALPFGDETCLQRVVRTVANTVERVAVVHASSQAMPELPDNIECLSDPEEYLGPLAGMATGLKYLEQQGIDAAYITGCDVPLLSEAFIKAMFEQLGDADIAVPVEEGYLHPLAGVYRTSLSEQATRLVEMRQLRPKFLIDRSWAQVVPVDDLRSVDPELHSLQNANDPETYQELLRLAGFAG